MSPRRQHIFPLLFVVFVLSALPGCGSDKKSAPRPPTPAAQAPSLGELLTVEQAIPAAPPPQAPTSLPTPTPAAAAAESPGSDDACAAAMAELKRQRAQVEAMRARVVEPDEKTMLAARNAFYACSTNPANCGADAKKMLEMKERADLALSRYEATLRKIAETEAGLYPYERAVDRACGRQ
jgi:hypothetical protein